MAPAPRSDSWIARERTGAPPPWWFHAAAWGLGALTAGVLLLLAGGPALAAEQDYVDGGTGPVLLQAVAPELGLAGARAVAAVATGLAVVATAHVGRLLVRQAGVGLVAAGLVAVDPSILALGHVAGPAPVVMATALGALACFLSPARAAHWCGAALLFLSAFLHPPMALWALALLPLRLLRGHIYAAPKHLGLAFLQTGLPAGLGAFFAWVGVAGPAQGLAACMLGGPSSVILATVPWLGGTRYAIPNVAVWFGGLAALLTLALGGLWVALGRFRIHRNPGRITVRLPRRMDRPQARAIWMLLLVLALPVPWLWLPLLATALAAAVGHLAKDSKGFGLLIGALLFGFALMYTARVWGLITGAASPAEAGDLLDLIPWLRGRAC